MNSLRQRSLLLILLPLFVLIGVGAYVSYGRAVESANQAYDRSLYLAARTLAEEIRLENQTLRVDVLRAAGYFFENHIGSRLFYKIEDEAGLTLAGVGLGQWFAARRPGLRRGCQHDTLDVSLYRLHVHGGFVCRHLKYLEKICDSSRHPGLVEHGHDWCRMVFSALVKVAGFSGHLCLACGRDAWGLSAVGPSNSCAFENRFVAPHWPHRFCDSKRRCRS